MKGKVTKMSEKEKTEAELLKEKLFYKRKNMLRATKFILITEENRFFSRLSAAKISKTA